jgi:hypothetical protein
MEYTPEIIIKTVSDFYKVPIEMTVSTSRKGEYITARQVSMYFMRELIDKMPLREIGLNFSGKERFKSHCTVLHACKTVNNMIDTDKYYAKNINKLLELFECGIDEMQKESEDEFRTNALVFENTHLRNEIIKLKSELSKLQGVIYGLKAAKKQIKITKRDYVKKKIEQLEKPKIQEPEKMTNPFSHIPARSYEYKSYSPHNN